MSKKRDQHIIRVQHLHDGNSTLKERQNSVYMTVAMLIDPEGAVVERAVARCRKGDHPKRQDGRVLALGRLLSAIHPGVSFRVQ